MKLFVISDVHSFYTPMIEALNEAGFEKDNPNHLLISCGDNFDRGDESEKVLNYLLDVHNKVLIRGNHEDLLLSCCNRGYPEFHDGGNGTVKTITELGHYGKNSFELACEITKQKVSPLMSQMVNYFETENYVFVHSFIPYHYEGNWREAPLDYWKDARWVNPFRMCDEGYWKEDKTIVFGHWHTSKKWRETSFEKEPIYDIYDGDRYIAIDGCTVKSNKVNILVLGDYLI